MKECTTITEKYIEDAIPGKGELIKQEGYSEKLHPNEISMAKWMIKTFGGSVVLLNEKKSG